MSFSRGIWDTFLYDTFDFLALRRKQKRVYVKLARQLELSEAERTGPRTSVSAVLPSAPSDAAWPPRSPDWPVLSDGPASSPQPSSHSDQSDESA